MPKCKFNETMYVTAYQLARGGASNADIAAALGVNPDTLNTWQTRYPAMADAIDRGRGNTQDANTADTFGDYIVGRLSPDARAVWDTIMACEELENGVERIEAEAMARLPRALASAAR